MRRARHRRQRGDAEAIAAVKPKLRGVSHEWAFFLSLGFGAALIILAEDPEGDPGGGDLRGQPLGPVRHQRPLPPGQLDPAASAPVDAAPGSLDDLLPHRRHLHALRAARPRRHARRRDPRRRLDRRDRRRDRRDDLDRPPEMGLGADLPLARLGRRRRLPRALVADGRRPAPCWSPPAASSTPPAPSSTRPSARTRTRRSSATTRSSTCSSSPPPSPTSPRSPSSPCRTPDEECISGSMDGDCSPRDLKARPRPSRGEFLGLLGGGDQLGEDLLQLLGLLRRELEAAVDVAARRRGPPAARSRSRGRRGRRGPCGSRPAPRRRRTSRSRRRSPPPACRSGRSGRPGARPSRGRSSARRGSSGCTPGVAIRTASASRIASRSSAHRLRRRPPASRSAS